MHTPHSRPRTLHAHTVTRSCAHTHPWYHQGLRLLLHLCLNDDQPETEDGWDGQDSPRPPASSPGPATRAQGSPTHRHGLAAVQRVDGRLGLSVGGELHKGAACSKRRRAREGQQGLSGGAGATGEGTGGLDGRSVSDTGSQKVRQSEQRDEQSRVQTDSRTIKDQATRQAHSQPRRLTSASWPSVHSESQPATRLFVTRTVRQTP